MLDIGMSELVCSDNVLLEGPEICSSTPSGAQHTPLCDVRSVSESLSNVAGNSTLLDADVGIVGLEPRHHGSVPSDACATARTPLSNVAGNSTLLDADVGIVGLVPEHP